VADWLLPPTFTDLPLMVYGFQLCAQVPVQFDLLGVSLLE